MWIQACSRIAECVHPVFAQRPAPKNARAPIILGPVGTAFCINANADLLTAAHVVYDDLGDLRRQLSIAVHLIGHGGGVAGANLIAVDRDLDLAVLRISPRPLPPRVRFAAADIVPMGGPVASIGYPIPQSQFGEDAATFKLTRRFSGGHLSGTQADYSLWKKGPEVPVYELNLLCYHGNSGGPLFDDSGRVVGIAQGTLLHQGNTAAFALGIRNTEILPFLEKHGIQFEAAVA